MIEDTVETVLLASIKAYLEGQFPSEVGQLDFRIADSEDELKKPTLCVRAKEATKRVFASNIYDMNVEVTLSARPNPILDLPVIRAMWERVYAWLLEDARKQELSNHQNLFCYSLSGEVETDNDYDDNRFLKTSRYNFIGLWIPDAV